MHIIGKLLVKNTHQKTKTIKVKQSKELRLEVKQRNIQVWLQCHVSPYRTSLVLNQLYRSVCPRIPVCFPHPYASLQASLSLRVLWCHGQWTACSATYLYTPKIKPACPITWFPLGASKWCSSDPDHARNWNDSHPPPLRPPLPKRTLLFPSPGGIIHGFGFRKPVRKELWRTTGQKAKMRDPAGLTCLVPVQARRYPNSPLHNKLEESNRLQMSESNMATRAPPQRLAPSVPKHPEKRRHTAMKEPRVSRMGKQRVPHVKPDSCVRRKSL